MKLLHSVAADAVAALARADKQAPYEQATPYPWCGVAVSNRCGGRPGRGAGRPPGVERSGYAGALCRSPPATTTLRVRPPSAARRGCGRKRSRETTHTCTSPRKGRGLRAVALSKPSAPMPKIGPCQQAICQRDVPEGNEHLARHGVASATLDDVQAGHDGPAGARLVGQSTQVCSEIAQKRAYSRGLSQIKSCVLR